MNADAETGAADALDERVFAFLVRREEQRLGEIEDCLPRLQADVDGYFAAHHGDPDLPKLMGRLIREAAVAGFVRGTMYAGAIDIQIPPDRVTVQAALETCRSMPDLYRGFARFDRVSAGDDANEDGD